MFLHFQMEMLICFLGKHLLLRFMAKFGFVSSQYLWGQQSSYGHYTAIQREFPQKKLFQKKLLKV